MFKLFTSVDQPDFSLLQLCMMDMALCMQASILVNRFHSDFSVAICQPNHNPPENSPQSSIKDALARSKWDYLLLLSLLHPCSWLDTS